MESALNGISFNILRYKKKYFPRRCTEWSKVHLFRITGKLLVISWQNYGENHKPQGRGQEAEKQKNHGGREHELYLVYLAVTIGKKEIVEVEATKIYEVERQEQQECKKKDWL